MTRNWVSCRQSLVGLVLTGLLTAGPGCEGQLSGGDPLAVAKLSLVADALGALQAVECLDLRGSEACAQYPNPHSCDVLDLAVTATGSVSGRCRVQSGPTITLTKASEGIPLACRVVPEELCVQCEDIFGGAVVSTCGERTTTLFTGVGFDGQPVAVAPSPDTDDTPSTPGAPATPPVEQGGGSNPPSGSGASQCDPATAQQVFVAHLNQILHDEGFSFSYQPDTSQIAKSSFFGGGFYSEPAKLCSTASMGSLSYGCAVDAKPQGRCYCHNDSKTGAICSCARMLPKALEGACTARPAACDLGDWSAAVWKVYGAATEWLGQSSKSKPQAGMTIANAKGPKDLLCWGSPLVLDLQGNGLELSSLDEGVRFDLSGHGRSQTAWVSGADDALLALDWDGNGRIDHGGELFGDARPEASDGFEALSLLDQPSMGGNGNGLVDREDFLFGQLMLWTDRDHDGASQPGELRSLAASGVQALSLATTRARRLDDHGNDLSLRSRFLRADGSEGEIVDVMLVSRLR